MMITLTTNLNDSGGYVGMIKAAIYARQPDATVIDLTHSVGGIEAAYLLYITHRHFPAGTVHLVVFGRDVRVRTICVEVPEIGYFIGPDNGIFSYILYAYRNCRARIINEPFDGSYLYPLFARDTLVPILTSLQENYRFESIGPSVATDALPFLTNMWAERHETRNKKNKYPLNNSGLFQK